jgi:hypothetical protein
MSRRHEQLERPRGRDDVTLMHAGRNGIWWQASDGMRIALAASEPGPAIERARLSMLALVLVMIASGRARP